MDRGKILHTAESIINGERQGMYGNAEDSFAIIAQMWSAYLKRDLTSYDVANMMILMKVARNANGVYKDDNWIDICGYAALGGEIQGMYDEPESVISDESKDEYDPELYDIVFENLNSSNDFFKFAEDLINKYGIITVGDIKDYYDGDCKMIDNNYGWTDTSGLIREKDKTGRYYLKTTEPRPLNLIKEKENK